MDSELDFWYFQLNFCAIHVSDSYYAVLRYDVQRYKCSFAAKIVQIADSYADNCNFIRLESHIVDMHVGHPGYLETFC